MCSEKKAKEEGKSNVGGDTFLYKVERSISFKLGVRLFGIGIIIALLLTVAYYGFSYSREVELMKENIGELGKSYQKSLSSAAWDYNEQILKAQMEGINSWHGVERVEYYSVRKVGDSYEKKANSSLSRGILKSNTIFYKTIPLYANSETKEIFFAEIRLVIGADYIISKLLNNALIIFGIMFLLILVVLLFLFMIFKAQVTNRIIKLANFFRENIDKKKHEMVGDSQISSPGRHDEIDVFISYINSRNMKMNQIVDNISKLNHTLNHVVREKMAELKEKNEHLKDVMSKNKMLFNIFLGDISDPLKEILSSLDSLKEFLTSDNIPRDCRGEQQENLQTIINESQKIETIIGVVKDVASSKN